MSPPDQPVRLPRIHGIVPAAPARRPPPVISFAPGAPDHDECEVGATYTIEELAEGWLRTFAGVPVTLEADGTKRLHCDRAQVVTIEKAA